MTHRRYDQTSEFSAETTPVGGRRLRGNFTRTGVFQYQNADGSISKEYRPPSEVFAPASLATYQGAAVTDLHPPDMVTPETFGDLNKGHILEAKQADPHVAGTLDVNDKGLIDKIDAKDRGEMSMGYTADWDPTPGVSPEGQAYDGVQRNIKINHVALLPRGAGRMGPTVALRKDSKDAVAILLQSKSDADTPVPMAKHQIGTVTYDAGSESHVQAVDAEIARLRKDADDQRAEATTHKAKAEQAEKRADAAEKQTDPKAIAKQVAERVNLIALARREKAKRADSVEARRKAWTYLDAAEVAAATDTDTIVKEVLSMLAPDLDTSGMDSPSLLVALKVAVSLSQADEEAEGETDPGMGGTGDGPIPPGPGAQDPTKKPAGPYDSKFAPRASFDSAARLRADKTDESDDDTVEAARERVRKRNIERSKPQASTMRRTSDR
jgi:hypothetical protein